MAKDTAKPVERVRELIPDELDAVSGGKLQFGGTDLQTGQIQSLVSPQQQAVQLSTQLLSVLSQTTNTIAAHMKNA